MSLRAWYPFNGHAKNQGAGNLELTQTTAPTYADDGKLSNKALSTGGFKWTAEQANSILNNDAMSFAFWIKPLNTSGGQIFGTGGMNPPNNRRFSFWQYESGNDFHWSWQNEHSSTTFTGGSIKGCFPTGVWTHCAITYSATRSPNVIVYINGEKKSESNGVSNCSTFAYDTPVIHSSGSRYIQDFRVYDHCLSLREVKQISQGLAMHYSLHKDNPNLVTNSFGDRTGSSYLVTTYSFDRAGFGRYLTPGEQTSITICFTPHANFSHWNLHLNNGSQGGWMPNIYSDGTTNRQIVTATSHTSWKYYNNIDPEVSNSDYANVRMYCKMKDGSSNNAAVTIHWVKLQIGSTPAEGWSPSMSENPNYYKLEHDLSGMKNNANRSNYISQASCVGGGGYLTAPQFNGQYLKTTAFSTNGWKDFTMSAWINPSSYIASDRSCVIIGCMYITLTSGGKIATYCYGKSPEGYHTSKTTIPLNQWTHVAAVWDNKNSVHKIYINGVEDFSVSCTGTAQHDTFGLKKEIGAESDGSSRLFKGMISDARIYATALSASDIKLLATSPISFIENGVLESHTFHETEKVNNIKFMKSGTTKNGDISELGYIGGMKVKTLSDGSAWARIHWLDVTTTNTYFADNDEVAFCNQPNRFSRMGLVDHFKTTGLPDGYTLLEYIQSSGSQYIDTGHYWTSENTKIEVDMTVVTDGTYRSMFGNEEYIDTGSSRYFTGIPHGSGSSYNIYLGSNSVCALPITVGTRFKVGIETNSSKQYTLSKNGSSIQTGSYSGSIQTKTYANITGTNTSTTGHIFLFANHNSQRGTTNAPTQNMAAMRLYGCKMYERGYLVRDFIPCKNPAGTVGLYDTQTRKFYTTPTGAFAAGATLDGTYEFMLTYPRMSATGYNRWTQTSSPNKSTVTGFTNIAATWTQEAHSGLRKHGSAAVYDCDSGDPWYAPIGQKSQWTTGKYIPAANGSSATETELWVRIDKLPNINKISMLDEKYIQAFEIKEI